METDLPRSREEDAPPLSNYAAILRATNARFNYAWRVIPRPQKQDKLKVCGDISKYMVRFYVRRFIEKKLINLSHKFHNDKLRSTVHIKLRTNETVHFNARLTVYWSFYRTFRNERNNTFRVIYSRSSSLIVSLSRIDKLHTVIFCKFVYIPRSVRSANKDPQFGKFR